VHSPRVPRRHLPPTNADLVITECTPPGMAASFGLVLSEVADAIACRVETPPPHVPLLSRR
jgi:hypothetical protein